MHLSIFDISISANTDNAENFGGVCWESPRYFRVTSRTLLNRRPSKLYAAMTCLIHALSLYVNYKSRPKKFIRLPDRVSLIYTRRSLVRFHSLRRRAVAATVALTLAVPHCSRFPRVVGRSDLYNGHVSLISTAVVVVGL